MKWSFQGQWLASGFGLTVLFMALVSFVSYKNATQLSESATRIQQTYEILNNLNDFYAAMSVAESGRRGYVYLESKQELKRYQTAIINLRSEIVTLQKQIDNKPIEQKQFAYLKFLVAQRLSLLRQSIDLYQKDKTAVKKQLLITQRSIQLRDKILFILAQIKTQEQNKLKIWLEQSRRSINARIFLEIFGIFLSFSVFLGIYILFYYQIKQFQKLEKINRTIAQEKEISDLRIRLFSMISHEFRTPLSVILASSQLLKETLIKLVDESKLKNLYRIQSSVKLMNHFLTDILMLTRAEAGNLECKPEWLDIESFCLNLVEDVQFLTFPKHTIKFISQNSWSKVYLDEKILYSILNNLLLNAVNYSPDGGNIYLILSQELKTVIFQVKDEGIGIPTEDKEQIYEPFYRGQNVDVVVGTGLGLTVVKKCVELHQGSISMESTVGLGTTFTVKIPLKNEK